MVLWNIRTIYWISNLDQVLEAIADVDYRLDDMEAKIDVLLERSLKQLIYKEQLVHMKKQQQQQQQHPQKVTTTTTRDKETSANLNFIRRYYMPKINFK